MQLGIQEIKKIIPHRFPFLLIDRVIDLTPNEKLVAIKNVSTNEHFFEGHFPEEKIMPGVLIVEALAQTAGILMLSKEKNRGKIAYFMGIDKAKFRQRVVPGDQLRLEIEIVRLRRSSGQVHSKALVGGKVVAEANLMFVLGER